MTLCMEVLVEGFPQETLVWRERRVPRSDVWTEGERLVVLGLEDNHLWPVGDMCE